MILNQAILYGTPLPPPPPMKYVVACSSNIIITSPDGLTWTQQTTPLNYGTKSAGIFTSVRYNAGLYTITGSARGAETGPSDPGKAQICSSSDAVNWRAISMTNNPGLNVLDTVTNDSMYLNGFTYVVGDQRGQGGFPPSDIFLNRSFDTQSYGYTRVSTTGYPGPIFYNTLVHQNIGYLATGYAVYKTTDGKTLQQFGQGPSVVPDFITDLVYFSAINPTFYGVGSAATSQIIWRYRADISTWVVQKGTNSGEVRRIVASPSTMIAYGTGAYRSVNGLNWFTITPPVQFNRIVWDGTNFIGCSTAGGIGRLYSSPDGLAWTAIPGWNSAWQPLAIYAAQ